MPPIPVAIRIRIQVNTMSYTTGELGFMGQYPNPHTLKPITIRNTWINGECYQWLFMNVLVCHLLLQHSHQHPLQISDRMSTTNGNDTADKQHTYVWYLYVWCL